MDIRQIVFTDVNTAKLLDTQIPDELAPDEVAVKTVYSTVSAGTERANITGDPSVSAGASHDTVFPRILGYCSSGIVIAVGKDVESVKVGDRVAMFWTKHQSINIRPEKDVIKIEDDSISLRTAALGFISSFPMAAIRKTRLEMGESAMVMGLGILGIIAVKLLKLAGAAPIIAADPNPRRRELALENGADYALDPLEEGFAERVKKITGGGVNVAIEVTGVGAGLNESLDCMAKFGRVALLGCTRNPNFNVDYYTKVHVPGITLIGAHTMARPDFESHPGWFTHRDDIKAILKLCAFGRLDLENIIEETHSPKDCPSVYERLVFDKNFPIGVQFDWRLLDEEG